MREERKTGRGQVLPLEARLLLWRRVWGRLLAPPPMDTDDDEVAGGTTSDDAGGDERGTP